MTKGYNADAAKQGYEYRAKEPTFLAKIKALLEYLVAKQQELVGSDSLLVFRDVLSISVLWQPWFRAS
ncbi:TPA: hypothetical protein ACH3X1_008172 [Trebouxia sp. C0004]